MNAFITGSRAYGKPTVKSDIDLVIRCDPETERLLRKLSARISKHGAKEDELQPIRFGMLNIIVCQSDEDYAVWKLGTEHMKGLKEKGSPFDRDTAMEVLNGLRKMIHLEDMHDSGDR